ncbi:DUF2796 domain-containing protein [Alteromonas sp. 5E99-2]|uniref:ZrgA family zinc uptake protein n=1 Tax=Alteromonas sp. 5E99-2 TaxID=2817683 RepID=UPI001A99D362|nr:DUF2796 domain-containing protein [Alteromonas sp. 5E99-2]MBO1255603.1 DUF2796 domain-containing protein [Alteromonas sp. 5E99-2]
MKVSRKLGVSSCLFLFCILLSTKLHGKGTLTITQSDTSWYMQLNMPVLDLFNMDTIPRSQKLKAHIKSSLLLLNNSSAVVSIPEQCNMTKLNVLIPKEYQFSSEYGAKQHLRDIYALNDIAYVNENTDVEITLMFSCADEINQLDLTLFDTFLGFYTVDVDWKVNLGNGKAELSASSTTVYFSNKKMLKS